MNRLEVFTTVSVSDFLCKTVSQAEMKYYNIKRFLLRARQFEVVVYVSPFTLYFR